MKAAASTALAALLLCAAGPPPTPDLKALFPQAASLPQIDHRPSQLAPAGTGRVTVTPVRFSPLPGQSEAVNTVWCGISLESSGMPAQAVVTIGVESTEALSCNGLSQIAAMPPDGAIARIGLIYRTHSPNASSLTPIVVARDPKTGKWVLDDLVSSALGELRGKPSLATMRQALAPH